MSDVAKKHKTDPTNAGQPVPDWLLAREKTTLAQWRRKKRAEMQALRRAFEKYQEGCAYCPVALKDIQLMETKLDAMLAAHASARWRSRRG